MEKTEFLLQWGNRKRLRCVRIRNTSSPPYFDPSSTFKNHRKITSTFLSPSHQEKQLLLPRHRPRLIRNPDVTPTPGSNTRRGSPEKEESSYVTRGSASVVGNSEESGKLYQQQTDETLNTVKKNRGGCGVVWPKLYIGLSTKEKEQDFMAMKGCKLPQRPKKRAKCIQRTLLLVSPGAWLSDMTVERYEVREKKTSKKKRRGLKAMTSLDSESE